MQFTNQKSIIAGSLAVLAVAFGAASPALADAKATSIVQQAVGAYASLKSFTCRLSFNQQQGSRQESDVLSFEFRRPDSARLIIASGSGVVLRGVTDGKQMMVYSIADKEFVRRSVPSDRSSALMIASVSQSIVLKAFMKPDALAQMLEDPDAGSMYEGASTAGGVDVDLINATLESSADRSVKATFGFGRKDHLLHSVAMTITEGSQVAQVDEVLGSIKLNVDVARADFKVYSPTGVRELTKEDVEPTNYNPRVKPGATPLPINATDIDGRKVDLAQYRGKVLLIDFWATWCGPCLGELPNVVTAYKQYHNQGLEVIGFSQDQDEGTLKQFIAERGLPWREVFCGGPFAGPVSDAYGLHAIPLILLVGRDGKVAAVDLRGEEIVDAVRVALAKR